MQYRICKQSKIARRKTKCTRTTLDFLSISTTQPRHAMRVGHMPDHWSGCDGNKREMGTQPDFLAWRDKTEILQTQSMGKEGYPFRNGGGCRKGGVHLPENQTLNCTANLWEEHAVPASESDPALWPRVRCIAQGTVRSDCVATRCGEHN